ncbi:hypothetical protein R3P38DRAFT_2762330 [Favolaschia claudopus]|uniref:Uncharacterized protein n=1 Tax=Favolaschia claudopus TaxID=2862362 RepID=A0AAW0DG76_9AGAR
MQAIFFDGFREALDYSWNRISELGLEFRVSRSTHLGQIYTEPMPTETMPLHLVSIERRDYARTVSSHVRLNSARRPKLCRFEMKSRSSPCGDYARHCRDYEVRLTLTFNLTRCLVLLRNEVQSQVTASSRSSMYQSSLRFIYSKDQLELLATCIDRVCQTFKVSMHLQVILEWMTGQEIHTHSIGARLLSVLLRSLDSVYSTTCARPLPFFETRSPTCAVRLFSRCPSSLILTSQCNVPLTQTPQRLHQTSK